MKYTNRKRIMKITVLLGIGLLICQGISSIGFKNVRIRKLKEEAEEEIKKDEFDEAIKIYEKVEEEGEKTKELEVLKIYMESKEQLKKGNLRIAEKNINSINEATLNKVLREKINLLQEEISLEINLNVKLAEVKRLKEENEYIKGMEILKEIEKEDLDKKTIEDISKLELELKEEHNKYKENIKEKFMNDVIALEKVNGDYRLWEELLKEVLSELQKNLNEEEIKILREEHGRWRVGINGLSKNIKDKEIKSYVKGLIQKF